LDEETVKPCIQDRFRSIISRARDIFASFPIICLTILILIIITLPEILTLAYGREVIIPIFSKISLENRFMIIFSFSVALFSSLQYKINKSILRIEQQRSQPFLYAEISPDRPKILIENRGGGIAWGCKITLSRGDIDEFFEEFFEEIYSWSGEEMEIPVDWQTQSFDLCIGIEYYTKKEIHPDFKEHWERIFRKIKPFYDY